MLLKRIPTPPPALPTLMTGCAGGIYIFFLTPLCFASFCGKKNPSGKEKVISLFRLTFLRENEVCACGQKKYFSSKFFKAVYFLPASVFVMQRRVCGGRRRGSDAAELLRRNVRRKKGKKCCKSQKTAISSQTHNPILRRETKCHNFEVALTCTYTHQHLKKRRRTEQNSLSSVTHAVFTWQSQVRANLKSTFIYLPALKGKIK